MELFNSLINSVINNNYDEYKIILHKEELKFNSINETELILKLIRHKNIDYFKDLLEYKQDKIFYSDFDVLLKCILEENNYNIIKLLFSHKNMNIYLNINNIINFSNETNSYDILNNVINDELIDFSKNIIYDTVYYYYLVIFN